MSIFMLLHEMESFPHCRQENGVYSDMSITHNRMEKVNFTIPYWQVNHGISLKTGSDVTMDQFKNASVVIGVQRSGSVQTSGCRRMYQKADFWEKKSTTSS